MGDAALPDSGRYGGAVHVEVFAGATPLADRIALLERAGAGPFGVNFVPGLGQGSQADVELAAAHARLSSFSGLSLIPR
jgi:hypothetical protein